MPLVKKDLKHEGHNVNTCACGAVQAKGKRKGFTSCSFVYFVFNCFSVQS